MTASQALFRRQGLKLACSQLPAPNNANPTWLPTTQTLSSGLNNSRAGVGLAARATPCQRSLPVERRRCDKMSL